MRRNRPPQKAASTADPRPGPEPCGCGCQDEDDDPTAWMADRDSGPEVLVMDDGRFVYVN